MSVVVLVGRTREQRRRALAPVAGLDAWQRPDFLYLTATRRKADVIRAAWWDQPDKPPTFLPDARPWGAFRDDLAARWGDGRTLMGPVARELLAGAVFRSLKPRLRVWGGLRDGPQTRRALAAFAEDWGLGFAGDTPPELGEEPYSLRFPGEPDHAWGPLFATTSAVGPALRQDAWFFLRAWRRALERSGAWTDRPGLARGLLQALREPAPQLLGALSAWRAVIVDDLLWLPPLDRAVLQAFVAAHRRARPQGTVHLCLEAPTGADPERVRAWIGGETLVEGLEVTQDLRRDWGRWLDGGRLLLADAEAGREDLADLVARDAVVEDCAAAVGDVRVRGYSSMQAEIRGIARALKAEVLAGRAADELFVSFPDLDRYAPVVRDVFTAYGIPFVVEKGEELLHSPPCSAARQLLRLATEPVEPVALRSLLASGWIRAAFPVDVAMLDDLVSRLDALLGPRFEAVKRAALERVEELVVLTPDLERLHPQLVASGASGRPREWLEPVAAHRLRLARDEIARARGDAQRIARIEERLQRDLVSVLVDVLALERLLDSLSELCTSRSARQAAQRFGELLSSLGIRAEEPGPEVDRVLARAMRANGAAIESLMELVHHVAGTLEGVEAATPGSLGDGGPVDLLREALEEAVRETRYRARGPAVGVQIVGLRDLHGADVPWLWVGGLTDGAFPRGPRPDFLLPRLDPPLVPTVDRGDEDRAIFGSLLRNMGHGERADVAVLRLSWPRSEAGRDLVPSALLADLLELRTSDGGTLGDWWAQEQRQEEASLPQLLSRDELLTRPDLCARIPTPAPPPTDDPLGDPVQESDAPLLLSASDRTAMSAWDELVAARSSDDGFGAWDGVIALGRPWRPLAVRWLRDLLRVTPNRLGRPTLSLRTTGLERWAKCPIRYFFEAVLGLEEPKAFAMEPGRDESGTLVHEVLERFLSERITAKAAGTVESSALWTLGPADREAAERRLRSLALEIAEERLSHRRGPWVKRLVEDLVSGLAGEGGWLGPLARFVAEETRGPFLDAEPAHVEYAFDGVSPALVAYRMPPKHERDPVFKQGTGDIDVRLRGSVDRVDLPTRRAHGGHPSGDGGLRVAVYDYKTGRTPHIDDVDKGLQLQPVLYPVAVDVPRYASGMVSGYWELAEEPGRQRRRLAISSRLRGYLLDQRGLRRPVGFKWTTKSVSMWAWRAWLMRADWYGQMVAWGVFPPTLHAPKVAGCQYCPFRRACRTEPVRTERVLNPLPRAGRTPPVFWPASVSVWEGLDAMFGAGEGDEPDEEPPLKEQDATSAPANPGASLPSPLPVPGPVKTDEFDDMFGDDLF